MQRLMYLWIVSILLVIYSSVLLLLLVCSGMEYRRTIKIPKGIRKVIWLLPGEVKEATIMDLIMLSVNSLFWVLEILMGIYFLFHQTIRVLARLCSGILLASAFFGGGTILFLAIAIVQDTIMKKREHGKWKNETVNEVLQFPQNGLIGSIMISKARTSPIYGTLLWIPFGWGVDASGFMLDDNGKPLTITAYGRRQMLSVGGYDMLAHRLAKAGYEVIRMQFQSGKRFNSHAGINIFLEELGKICTQLAHRTDRMFLVGHGVYGVPLAIAAAGIIPASGLALLGGDLRGIAYMEDCYAKATGIQNDNLAGGRLRQELLSVDEKRIRNYMEKFHWKVLRIADENFLFEEKERAHCIKKLLPVAMVEWGRRIGIAQEALDILVKWMEDANEKQQI